MNPDTTDCMNGSVAEQGVQWFLINRDGALSDVQRRAFLAWLRRSPEHVRAYLRALDLHRQVGEAMPAASSDLLEGMLAETGARRPTAKVVPLFAKNVAGNAVPTRRGRRRWTALAAAACLVLVLGASLSRLWPQEQVLAAGHGELRELVLADRTQVRLNADSAIRVRMGWLDRRVELLRGEASFDVAPDRRAFEVQVGELRVRDIGTVFDVSRRLQNTRIGVVSGEVEVWRGDSDQQRLASLVAGRVVLVDNDTGAVQPLDMPASMLLDWQHRKVSFLDERLDEVAAAFNRHNRVQVVIEDDAAAAMRLSGSLDADRIVALQAFLARDPRFKVQRRGDTVHVHSR